MKKQVPPDAVGFATGAPAFGWKRQQSQHGPEFIHYPSDLARQFWLYPHSIGRARTVPGGRPNEHRVEDGYLLHYVTRGELWHRINNRIYLAQRGEACLMDMTKPIVHGAGGDRPAISLWVRFNGKNMARFFSELRADRDPIFHGLDTAMMARLFADLLRLTENEDYAYETRAAGLLTLLLAELQVVRARHQPLISLGTAARLYSEPVRKGIDWMVRYYDFPHSLKRLCAAVGYSRSHYSRLFRRETGVPPVVWLNRYRMVQAKRLLTGSDKSIAEIAQAVGVPDQNYFARLFRSLASQTPRQFREQMLKRG